MNRSNIITLLVMAIVIALVASYILFRDQSLVQKRNNTPAAQALLIDDEAQAFTNLEGEKVPVDEYFGKIIIVTSWASWCPQCVDGLTQLGQLAQDYQDREVVVLAINRAENRYTAQRYLETISMPEGLKVILDPGDHYFKASTGYAMPETIVYTKDGEVGLHQRGNVNAGEIRQLLDELLK